TPRNACLYGALSRTVTPMGARRLRDWLSQPLTSVVPIQRRQEAIRILIEDSGGMDAFRKQLAKVRDLERTIGRLTAGAGNGRDLAALRLGLEQIPALKGILQSLGQRPASSAANTLNDEFFRENGSSASQESAARSLIGELESEVAEMPDLVELLGRTIVDE